MGLAAQSVDEFCEDNDISRAFFYNLVKCKKGPRIMKLGKRTLISRESGADWRRQIEQETAKKAQGGAE